VKEERCIPPIGEFAFGINGGIIRRYEGDPARIVTCEGADNLPIILAARKSPKHAAIVVEEAHYRAQIFAAGAVGGIEVVSERGTLRRIAQRGWSDFAQGYAAWCSVGWGTREGGGCRRREGGDVLGRASRRWNWSRNWTKE